MAAWGDILAFVLTTVAALALALLLAWRPLASRLNLVVDPLGVVEKRVRARHEARQGEAVDREDREPARVG